MSSSGDEVDDESQVHVTLIGGGWDEDAQPAIYESFVQKASAVAARHPGVPRVAIVLLDEEAASTHSATASPTHSG